MLNKVPIYCLLWATAFWIQCIWLFCSITKRLTKKGSKGHWTLSGKFGYKMGDSFSRLWLAINAFVEIVQIPDERNGWVVEFVQDFLIKLDMKPCIHLVEISIFSLYHVIIRLTKIMNNLLKHLKIRTFKVISFVENWSDLS